MEPEVYTRVPTQEHVYYTFLGFPGSSANRHLCLSAFPGTRRELPSLGEASALSSCFQSLTATFPEKGSPLGLKENCLSPCGGHLSHRAGFNLNFLLETS